MALLLGQLRPDLDAGVVADLLLAPFAGELLAHLRDGRGIPFERLDAAVQAVAGSVAEPCPTPAA